ncbi:hypothetical protein [Candidatus Amarobacter glycogenicus]|uniref:hypothetical protein n=1 Tax=Candidatus Amarobacter glycogenicus TaxID=3140699 RepID=UPI002A109320|nr:hypothetical protein [Dehalococcoidia bacterium]
MAGAQYLVELGGAAQSEQHVIGPGWEVHLSQLAGFQIGSLRIGEIRMEVTAQADIISELKARLDRKLIRGGKPNHPNKFWQQLNANDDGQKGGRVSRDG